MKTERWQRVERLFHAACALPPAGRRAFLEQSCGDDAHLRSEVLRMLELDGRHDIIDTPVLVRRRLGSVPDAAGQLDPPTGTMIGPYRLVERAASGGMGVIYRAVRTDELLDFEVALKLVRRGVESASLVQRFEDERQTLAHLAHPNIAHLLDGGTTDDGRPYLVMEYIHGRPIDRYCDERKLTIDQRIELFCVVCRAVHFAHQNLVVHCDLKPGNVLVTDDGTPRIVDFGVARMIDRPRRNGGAGGAGGTPQDGALATPDYASPELIAGAPVTTAVDVYALGVVLFDLLTGRLPGRLPGPESSCSAAGGPRRPSDALHIDRAEPACAQIAAQRGTTPRRLRRRLRGDLDAIVCAALHPEPARRYASAAQLARDLERSLSGQPVMVRNDTVLYRSAKFVLRHRIGVLLAMLVALTLSASVVAVATMAIAADGHREAARLAEIQAREQADDARLEAADALAELATVLEAGGAHDRARETWSRALTIRRRILGDDDPLVVRTRRRLTGPPS